MLGVMTAPRVGQRQVSSIRRDFPLLSPGAEASAAASGLAYLDNASTTQKPRAVLNALQDFYERNNANVHRAIYALGQDATEAYERARETVRRFLGARDCSEVVFTRGTTESINLVAATWARQNLQAGDQILLTEMEHHSNLIPWQLVAREKGAELTFLPFNAAGELDWQALDRVWTDRVRLVAAVHMSNVFGTVNDVARMGRLAHERGALILVDGAQSAAHMAVDVRELGCDFFAFSGHKVYGPTGIGALYGKQEHLLGMPPFMSGGEMIGSVWLDRATWNSLPYKFEAGTPNVAGAVGLGAALDYVTALGLPAVAEYEGKLTAYALERLAEVPELTLYGSAAHRGAVISFNLGDIHAHDVAQFLDSRGIAVRAGHHCAQPLMRKLGVPATTRASLSFYNTPREVDRLVEALGQARGFFL